MYRAFIMAVALLMGVSQAKAEAPTLVGFSEDVRITILNDFLWYKINFTDSRILQVLSLETMGPQKTDPQWISKYLLRHFPLAMSKNQSIKTCPTEVSKCQETNYDDWPVARMSVQQLASNMLGLYTPYLDRNFETTVIGLNPMRWLSVSSPNQTIAIVDEAVYTDFKDDQSSEYKRWVRLGHWMGLARLHQIFASEGKALKQCTSDNGTRYVCDTYDNGSMYFTGIVLLSGSVDCKLCSEKEKAMLRISAFDHLVRTGKSEKSENILDRIEGDMIQLMKSGAEDPFVAGITDMYKTRYYSNNSAPSFTP